MLIIIITIILYLISAPASDVHRIIFETGPELHFDFSWRMAYNIIPSRVYLRARASLLVKTVFKRNNNNITKTTWFYNADIENLFGMSALSKTCDYNIIIIDSLCSRHDSD